MNNRLVLGCALAVTLLTTAAGPALAQEGTSVMQKRCTPGYSPCIALKASDVDCWGGSGNGPRYTAPYVTYRVTGSDRYRLDADHDGWGCE